MFLIKQNKSKVKKVKAFRFNNKKVLRKKIYKIKLKNVKEI